MTQKHSMKKQTLILILLPVVAFLTVAKIFAHDDEVTTAGKAPVQTQSAPGSNIWNAAQEPTNWWNEIRQAHGHVGPWNVLGWRMGKAALRELGAMWGRHELDVVCHVPLKTPYSCVADGLVVGTGNSIGRLDIRLAEAPTMSDIHVSVRRKDGTGPVLLFKPDLKYLGRIRHQPDQELEALSHECGRLSKKSFLRLRRFDRPTQVSLKTDSNFFRSRDYFAPLTSRGIRHDTSVRRGKRNRHLPRHLSAAGVIGSVGRDAKRR